MLIDRVSNQSMEIVINGRFLTQNVSGVQRYARELLHSLDTILEDTADIKITVLSPSLMVPAPAWRNIRLRQVGRLHGHAWEQIELPWYSRGHLLFCPGNTAPILSLLSQPVVVTVHDLSYKYFPEAYHPMFRLWYRFLTPLIFRYAQSIITVSESERRAINKHHPKAAARLQAIPNGGFPAGISTICLEGRSSSYILCVGSFSKRKNFPRIFETACRLAREREFNFVFVGEASKTFVNTHVHVPEDLTAKITFVGAINDPAELVPYYCKAACLLFPSLYESSGLPPIEAMACGCPVIVSDISALRERCGDAAIYCDPTDINSIIASVLRLMDDGALRSKLSTVGLERAAKFSWRECARATLDLLRICSRAA
jgi:glycosyltransferase involved in cell wall biosynthesis